MLYAHSILIFILKLAQLLQHLLQVVLLFIVSQPDLSDITLYDLVAFHHLLHFTRLDSQQRLQFLNLFIPCCLINKMNTINPIWSLHRIVESWCCPAAVTSTRIDPGCSSSLAHMMWSWWTYRYSESYMQCINHTLFCSLSSSPLNIANLSSNWQMVASLSSLTYPSCSFSLYLQHVLLIILTVLLWCVHVGSEPQLQCLTLI